MIKRFFLFLLIVFNFSLAKSEDNSDSDYIMARVPSGYENIYNSFITNNLKRLKNTGIYGKPIDFEIQYAKLGQFPIILSNDFISPLYDLESTYMTYRKNRYNKDKNFYLERFTNKQKNVKDIFADLSENSSKKNYLILLGIVTNEHSTKESKDKWVIIVNPENPIDDWSGWVIGSYIQKNTALILTSVDDTVLDFLNMPYSDLDILSEKYDDKMYRFILQPLYDNGTKEPPFSYPFQ